MPTVIDGTTGVSRVQDDVIVEATLANNAVTSAKMATAVKPIGVGQTWQNLNASRSTGVTYTNNTGRPIMVHVNGFGSVSTNAFRIEVGGIVMRDEFDVAEGSIQVIVPDNTTYVVFAPNGLNEWCELR